VGHIKITIFAKSKPFIHMITSADIYEAQKRITPYITRTPLLRVAHLDEILGCKAWLKPENLQQTGSFKLRGALNKLLSLTDQEKKHGVVCASSGNHGQAVAFAAKLLGINAKVVMPVNASSVKLEGVHKYEAQVILHGTVSSEREEKMHQIVEQEHRVSVHPFEDNHVKAGQGTISLEVLEENPLIDCIVAPIGGGGLISGMATAAKSVKPCIKMVGVEPSGAPRYGASRQAKKPIALDKVDTIADGTRTDKANPQNFPIIEKYVDELISVDDEYIKQAMKLLLTQAKLFVEPSGTLGIAAAICKKIPFTPNDNVCFMLSGGNCETKLLASIL
jgi:threonine dehydratase